MSGSHESPAVLTFRQAGSLRRSMGRILERRVHGAALIVAKMDHNKWYIVQRRDGRSKFFVDMIEKDRIIDEIVRKQPAALIITPSLSYLKEDDIISLMKAIKDRWFVSPITGTIMKLGDYQPPAKDEDTIGKLKYCRTFSSDWKEMYSYSDLFDSIITSEMFYDTDGAAMQALAMSWRTHRGIRLS